MDKIPQLLRNSVINSDVSAAVAIRNIVGNRVYPSQIASIVNPTYPCVNFEINLGAMDSNTSAFRGNMRLWCWSAAHTGAYNKSEELFQKMIDYWHMHAFSDSTLSRSVTLKQRGTSIKFFDEVARAYAVVSNWDVFGAQI